MLRPDMLPDPGPSTPLFVPYPESYGLQSLYQNVRKTDAFPDGLDDGMTLVVAEPKRRDGESIEATWARIGYDHAELEATPDYQLNPGPLDLKFFHDNWQRPGEVEQLVAPTSERTPEGMARHILAIVSLNEQHIPDDTPTHIGLGAPHIGSGDRFQRPFWGWDSFFDQEGLRALGDQERVRATAENVATVINKTGSLANSGLRVIADRPHPPLDGHVFSNLAGIEGPQVLQEFLPIMVKNWTTWTAGRVNLAELPLGDTGMSNFSFLLDDGSYLEGVGSTGSTPRPEMYLEDIKLAHMRAQAKKLTGEAYQAEMRAFYDNIRGGALMGNDFHGGQLADGQNLYSIQTVGRMSVTINSLLAYDEFLMAQAYRDGGDMELARFFHSSAMERVEAMNRHLYHPKNRTYQDRYADGTWAEPDANMAYPLYVGIVTPDRVDGVRQALEDYVRKGGVVTTLNRSRQSWGAMTDWAMTAHVVIRGLERAGHGLAGGEEGERALALAVRAYESFLMGSLVQFQTTGTIDERVNAENPAAPEDILETGEYKNVGNFPTRGLVVAAQLRSHPLDSTGGALPFDFTIRKDLLELN